MKQYIIITSLLLAVAIITPMAIKAQTPPGGQCFENFQAEVADEVCLPVGKYGICEDTTRSTPKKGCEVSIGCANGTSCNVVSDSEQKNLCGTNQNVDPWEECDDNDKTNGDGCSADCQVERGWKCTLDDVSDLSVCAMAVGRGSITRKDCTLFQNSSQVNEQCLFGLPKSCIPGSGPASICQNGVAVPCGIGNLCLGGKCQRKDPVGLNFVNGFNPNLETIVFVPSARVPMEMESPAQFDGISDQAGDRFNFVYFPYKRSKRTDDLAKDFNVMVKQLTNLNGGYSKRIKFVTHSYGHTIVRTAILRANGYTQSSPNVPDNKIKDDQVAVAYARSEFYSVSGPIGGSQYFWFIPRWPTTKFGELTPTGSFETWLFSEGSVQKFNSEIGGYHSFDVAGDTFMRDLDNCDHPTLPQTILGLPQWCKDYERGKSRDHIKFGTIGENLMSSEEHPGVSDVEAELMLGGLKTGWGTPDRNYCKNGLVTVTEFGFIGRDVGHSILLFHPKVISVVLSPDPTILITTPATDGPVTIPFQLATTFNAPVGSHIKEVSLSVDDVKVYTIPNSQYPNQPVSPWSFPYTVPLSPGRHEIYSTITSADNTSNLPIVTLRSNSRFVTIANTPTPALPTLTISSPAPNNIQPLTGSYPLIATFTAPADSSVKEAKLYVNGNLDWTWKNSGVISCPVLFALSASVQALQPRECLLPANSQLRRMLPTWLFTPAVSHKIKFEVTDQAGRKASAERQFTVAPTTPNIPLPSASPDITPPTVEITVPPKVTNDLLSQTLPLVYGQVTISARAKDPSGISIFTICANDNCQSTNFNYDRTTPQGDYFSWTAGFPLSSFVNQTNQTMKVLAIAYDRANPSNRGVAGLDFPSPVRIIADGTNSGTVVFCVEPGDCP